MQANLHPHHAVLESYMVSVYFQAAQFVPASSDLGRFQPANLANKLPSTSQ